MTNTKGGDVLKIPVTLVTGFLGSGKTTFIHRLLKERHGMRIAVLQNEFSAEMGIEKPVLSAGGASVFELPNGCLCCSLKDGIVDAVESILQFRCQIDWLFVEAAGNVDPLELMSNFWIDPESPLMLDGVLSVTCPAIICDILSTRPSVDDSGVPLFTHTLEKCASASTIGASNANDSTSTSVSKRFNLLGKDSIDWHDMRELMIKQLSVADIIIINKIDQLEGCLRAMRFCDVAECPALSVVDSNDSASFLPEDFTSILNNLNPTAKVLCTKYCAVDFDAVLNLQMFGASRIMSFSHEDHHHSHHVPSQSIVFVHSIGTYSLSYVNSFVSTLLWESGATIYRCKGIFRAINDCPMIADATGVESFFQLQGVGMLFEISEVSVTDVDDNRFLFIGPNLDATHITNGLNLPQ